MWSKLLSMAMTKSMTNAKIGHMTATQDHQAGEEPDNDW